MNGNDTTSPEFQFLYIKSTSLRKVVVSYFWPEVVRLFNCICQVAPTAQLRTRVNIFSYWKLCKISSRKEPLEITLSACEWSN